MTREEIQKEVDQNYEFFKKNKDSIDRKDFDKFVLIKNKEFLGFYTTEEDAITAGRSQFKDGVFSVQKVSDEVTNLGSIGYALFQ